MKLGKALYFYCTEDRQKRLPKRDVLRRARQAQEQVLATDLQLNPKERFAPLH